MDIRPHDLVVPDDVAIWAEIFQRGSNLMTFKFTEESMLQTRII